MGAHRLHNLIRFGAVEVAHICEAVVDLSTDVIDRSQASYGLADALCCLCRSVR